MHYNWHRYYDPKIGRYIRTDPISLYGGINLYSYSDSNPITYIDHLGLSWLDWKGFDYLDPIGTIAAGFGDSLSFGLTDWLRTQMGTNSAIDKCSSLYSAGEWGATAFSLAFGVAHLGRNAFYQTGIRGGLRKGVRRLFYDERAWPTVRDMWSRAAGGGRRWLALNKQSLHHWLIPRRLGAVNAGFNYLPISARFNSWMNGTTALRNMVEWAFRINVIGIYSAPITAGIND